MILRISKVGDLPVEVVDRFKRYGLTNGEILESCRDALIFLDRCGAEDWDPRSFESAFSPEKIRPAA